MASPAFRFQIRHEPPRDQRAADNEPAHERGDIPLYGERDGGEQEQNTDDNLYEHSGFRLPHTRNALALVGLGLALCGLASFRLLFLNVLLLIDTMLADVAPGLGIISAALVRVELPPALHASNNMLFHGMSNSLLFFRSADL